MIRSVLAGAALMAVLSAGLGASAVAQEDVITMRKNSMKGVGAATGQGTKFVKGEEPFDLAKALAILDAYAGAAAKMPGYYPETAKTGGQTSASPKIWETKADFDARFAAWGRDIEKAKTQVKDLDSFKAEFSTLTRACGSCHQTYRQRT
jgi:cytochrome c556